MFCTHCGSKVNDNDTVCGHCGALTELGEKVCRHDAMPPADGRAVNPDGSLNKDAYRPAASSSNGGTYYYAPQNAGYQPPVERKSNTMALAGFICAFVAPLIGLILSIIGSKRAGELGGEGKGMATAGIVISIVTMVLSFIAIVAYIGIIFEIINDPYYYNGIFLRSFFL